MDVNARTTDNAPQIDALISSANHSASELIPLDSTREGVSALSELNACQATVMKASVQHLVSQWQPQVALISMEMDASVKLTLIALLDHVYLIYANPIVK